MKIAIINDTHCGIKNGSDVYLDNAEAFYSKVFFPYLEEHNIKKYYTSVIITITGGL